MESIDPKILTFLTGLFSALILSFVPLLAYRQTHTNINRDSLFEFTLVLSVPVVYLIMFFIGTNIALSIGLVGSLSVVRFRTAIKSPKELIFILFAISIGVGLGSQNIPLTALSAIIVGLFVTIVDRLILKSSSLKSSFFLLKLNQKDVESFMQEKMISNNAEVISLLESEDQTTISLRMKGSQNTDTNQLYQSLSNNDKIQSIQIIHS